MLRQLHRVGRSSDSWTYVVAVVAALVGGVGGLWSLLSMPLLLLGVVAGGRWLLLVGVGCCAVSVIVRCCCWLLLVVAGCCWLLLVVG